MAKKPETVFKERIRPKLDMVPDSWWIKTQMLATVGVPDFLGCVNGLFVAIELKASEADVIKSRVTIQSYILHQINRSGGYGTYMYPENADKVIDEICERAFPTPY